VSKTSRSGRELAERGESFQRARDLVAAAAGHRHSRPPFQPKNTTIRFEVAYGLCVDAAGQNDLDLRDADDETILALAVAGQADYLVREDPS
jgi:hypothetical protein